MIKSVIKILVSMVVLVVVSSCSGDDEGDVCATLNPPPSCDTTNNSNNANNLNNTNNENNLNNGNNENNLNNTNNLNNASCEPACSQATPLCLDGVCVACDTTTDEGCGSQTPHCEVVDGNATCVACDAPGSTAGCTEGTTCTDAFICSACESNDVCTEADASVCEAPGTEDAACAPCQQTDDCAHIADTNQCHEGTCVECTPETEETDCNGKVCDATTFECTDLDPDDVRRCERPCVSDSHCEEGLHCVPTTYQGSFFGNYCLAQPERDATGNLSCDRPYPNMESVETVNGETLTVCMHNQNATTCEGLYWIPSPSCDPDATTEPDKCVFDDTTITGSRCRMNGLAWCIPLCEDDVDCPKGWECDGDWCQP